MTAVRQRAEKSAFALIINGGFVGTGLRRSGDPELLHTGLQGGALHTELDGCPRGTADDPLGRLERAHDVLPLRSL